MFSGILNFLSGIFVTPLVTFFTNLIPDVTTFFTGVISMVNYALTYIGFIINLLMIPKSLIVLLISLTIGIFGIDIAVRLIGLGMSLWKFFKP